MVTKPSTNLDYNKYLRVTSFPLADANGNAVTYLDNAGNVQAHYTYDAFGGTVSSDGDMDDDFAFRFSSKYLDAETGFYYYGYRYYDPSTGRWLSRDPIGESDAPGLYLFLKNDGVGSIDVLGLYSLWDWGQFLRWLENTPGEAERVDWEYFDDYGSTSQMLIDEWMENNNDALCNACENASIGDSWIAGLPGGSKSVKNQKHLSTKNQWIGQYLANASIAVGGIGILKDDKTCKCEFEFGLNLEAVDKGDFNDTDQRFFFGLISDRFMKEIIHERLKIGGDYHMYGLSYESVYREADCQ